MTEADVLAAVLAAPGTPAHWAGPPEELLAEALALPVDEVAAALSSASLCRRLGVHEAGADRVAYQPGTPGAGDRRRPPLTGRPRLAR